MWRQPHVKDIVHSYQSHGKGFIDFYDHLIRVSDCRIGRTGRSTEIQAVLRHCGTFDNGDIDPGAGFLIHVHGKLGDMDIAEQN